MNLLGKIFIVLILVMSVLFMGFAMAVYAFHENWRDQAINKLQPELKKAQAENKDLADQREKFATDLKKEQTTRTQAIAKLETERDVAQQELKTLAAQQAELEKKTRESVAAMDATQTNATRDRKEVEEQRTVLAEARRDRDSHFKEVMRLTDELNQKKNDLDNLKKRTDELAKDLAKAEAVMRKFGLDKNKDYNDVPPLVDGIVKATPGAGLVEISIGSDEGLIKGHRLEVYRTGGGHNTYVGRIEVVSTAPDRAVCKIDPTFQNSNVMVGDRVASRIQ